MLPKTKITILVFIAACLMTSLVVLSAYWNHVNTEQQYRSLALLDAKNIWNKDAAFRQWATLHGGVYVVADERTPPSPYLEHLEYRDIITADGTHLTLLNPAYMMRQMAEEFEEEFGVRAKITSKKLLNPDNKPDGWQQKVLTRFENGHTEPFHEIQDIADEPYLRYMQPMYMSEGCVKCHGHLGFKDGDLRGGVSVSVPLTPYLAAQKQTMQRIDITHALVWLTSLIALVLSAIYFRKLMEDSETDPLTRIANRRAYEQQLHKDIAQAQRSGDSLALIMIDIDNFKAYNDNYGHDQGDKVLQCIPRLIQHSLGRKGDFVARFGGEEFVVLLPDTRENGAITMGERIRLAIERAAIIHEYSETAPVITVSVGVAVQSGRELNAESLLKQADTALYAAKSAGRNQVKCYQMEMQTSPHHATTPPELVAA